MSDTTNMMKGVRSGGQKLIKNECPNLLDVGCICHLADLAINQVLIDVFYYFYHSSKRKVL